MLYRGLADLVLCVHAAFVAFVVLGGLLALRWPRAAWVHLPALAWGVFVEFTGALCPLTPLEALLRRHGGEAGYSGGFLDHYLTALLYPEGLTREGQLALGAAALTINAIVYGAIVYGWTIRQRTRSTTAPRPG